MGVYEDTAGQKALASIVVIEMKIGASTTYFTRHHATIQGIDGPIEGRVLSFGVLDREMTDGGPVFGDVTVRFANTDGGFDDFLAELADPDKNLIRADVRFFRGFAGLDFSDYRQVGRTQFAELQGQGFGFVDVHFTDREDDLFGDLITPRADDVLKLIAEVDTDFEDYTIRIGEEDRVVQLAAGQFLTAYLGLPNDCLEAVPVATVITTVGTRTFEQFVYLVAISPFDFVTTDNAFDNFWLDFENPAIEVNGNIRPVARGETLKKAGGWSFWDFPSASPTGGSIGTLKAIDLTATAGYYVLAVLVESGPLGDSVPTLRIGMAQDINGAGRPWLNPIEMMKHFVDTLASNPGRWIDGFVDVDGTIADTLLRVQSFRGRIVVSKTTKAIEYVKRVAHEFGIDLFYNRLGELSSFVLPFEGGDNPTYASAPRFTVSEHFGRDSMLAYRGGDGQRNGLLNRLTIKVRFPWHGGPIGSVNNLAGIGPAGESLVDTRDKLTIEVVDEESEQKHERSISDTIDSDFHDWAAAARRVALRRTGRQRDPRYVVVQDLSLEGTIVDLGDVVHTTRPFPKGFELGRFGIVEKIRDDLDNDVVTLEVADYHDELTSKPYILGTETEFVKDSGTGAKTLDVTANSATLDFFGVDFSGGGANILTDDIIGCRLEKADRVGGDNEFVAVIDTVSDLGGGHWRLTIKPASGGDEFGQRPDTNEADIEDWRILESDATAATAREVFGKLADSNDSEPLARAGHTLTARTLTGDLYLFGGLGSDLVLKNDLWKWDGSVWTQLTPTGGPPDARISHAAYYDVENDRIYIHGGQSVGPVSRDDIWSYDVFANTWTDVTPGTKPSARHSHTFAEEQFGPGDAILFGGNDAGGLDAETWRWDPTLDLFTLLAPATSPTARSNHAMAVFPSSKVVLFGGVTNLIGPVISAQTWEWDGTTWLLKAPATTPTARTTHAMIFDDDDLVIRMICGQNGALASDLVREVWEWDGSDWSLKSDLIAPDALREMAVAYDTVRRTIIMMGGLNGSNALRSETWILDMNRRSWRTLIVDRTKTLLGSNDPYTYADY